MGVPIAIGAGLIYGAWSERAGVGVNYRDLATVGLGSDEQMENTAFNRAKTLLVQEEGRRNVVYNDSRGVPTVGIGHRVLASDRLKVGDSIDNARIDQLFTNDISIAFSAAKRQAKEIKKYNADMIARLTSVNFQLGTGWTKKFPNTWTHLREGNSRQAVSNILVSVWAQQTPNRANAFVIEIKNQFA